MERIGKTPTKAQELVYELRVKQVMSSDLIVVPPDWPMSQVKALMRTHRISGAPVVQDGKLVGMVSLEQVIRALEAGQMDACVRDRMTASPHVLREEETVISAINQFARHGYGRFPVINAAGELVGLLTKGDIVSGLLKQMELLWHAEEERRYQYQHMFEDIESDQTTLTLRYQVRQHDFDTGGEASSKIKRALERLGAHPQTVRRVAVATYEAEINIMIHSVGGELIAELSPGRIVVVAQDAGPGIEDVEQAMLAGYSTAPDWIRELGFGAGMGLSNIRSCCDTINLTSEMGVGTRLEMVFFTQDRGAR
ncbi:MAG: CBS domain-containing protein [Chloroflexi bacterium]|jgi:CBS domain-containing protein/anti-sigma regulatory factor (Ser/Thr protein kinase)|nr:CBS domain-containing protein [Chloroflexota bacterium]